MNDDGIDGLLDVRGAEIARLGAENRRLRERLARMQAARSDLRDAHAHLAYVELAGRSADLAANGRRGRSPRIELNAAIRAMVAAGLAAAPAGDPVVQGLVAAFGLSGEDASAEPATDPENPPLRLDLQGRRMTRCQSDDDGYCGWPDCPQNRDLEPEATGRHCPLDVEEGGP